jgi:hypothetical protein
MLLRRIRGRLSGSTSTTHRSRKATLALEALESREVLSASPTISTFAGTGTVAGRSGDFGPAVDAELNFPQAMAVDSHGNVFIADAGNDLVREVTPVGVITTFAGNGIKGFSGDHGQALQAELNDPVGVAVDANGDVYISDAGNDVVRMVAPGGIITTFAGIASSPGYSGDGKAATSARLGSPGGLAVDGAGNVYIADPLSNVVRKVNKSGIISTFAGTGAPGYTGNGKLATQARLNQPTDVAVDPNGNVFIADSNNDVIREVIASGIVRTVAGNGDPGFSGDGGRATRALLDMPVGVAVDANDNIWISDNANDDVRMVTGSTGIIRTLAGNGNYGFSGNGDGAPATQAELNGAHGLLVYQGNLLVADQYNDVVRKVTFNTLSPLTITPALLADGKVGVAYHRQLKTTGGTGPYTYSLVGGALPPGLSLSPAGLISGVPLALDNFNFTIQVSDQNNVTATLNFSLNINSTFTIRTFASTGAATPTGMAMDSAGDIFFADPVRNLVLEMTPTGKLHVVAGDGFAGFRGDGGPALSAELNHPVAVAVDSDGNLFIADENNDAVREVSQSGIISTVAGTPGFAGYSGDDGPANVAQLDHPVALVLDSTGDLLIADSLNDAVREVTPGGTISTYAGNGKSGYSGDGKGASSAELSFPLALAIDANDNLYIADTGNDVVRKVTSGGIISTFAGNGYGGNSGDGGPAADAELEDPVGLATDRLGNVYIEDLYNAEVRAVNKGTGIIDTIAGNGVVGVAGNGGPATAAALGLMAAGKVVAPDGSYYVGGGMVVDSHGNLYIADEGDRLIRRVNARAPVFVSAASTVFTAGVQSSFTVAAAGFPVPVLTEASGDTLPSGISFDTATGRLHGMSAPGVTGTWLLHFTASNGAGTDAAQTFILTIGTPPVIATTPGALVVQAHQRAVFTASALGTPVPKVQWQVSTDGGQTYVPIKGATSTTLSFIATRGMNGRRYRAVFDNGVGPPVVTGYGVLTVT